MARVTFVTHEGTRTGAPVILLTLMRWLRANTDLQLSTLALRPGPLLEEFARLGTVRLLDEWQHFSEVSLALRTIVELASSPKAKTTSRAVRWMGEGVLRSARRVSFRALRECDLVYANSIDSARGVRVVRDHQPLICHLHEGPDYLLRESYAARIQAMVLDANRVIAPSSKVQQLLVESVGVPMSAVTLCHEFIDIKDSADPRQRAAARAELDIAPDAFVVGMCGDANWRKAPDVFSAVAREVLKHAGGRNVVFLWVGGNPAGPAHRYMRYDIDRLGLGDHIRFYPHQEDALPFMRTFDVFFLSSRSDVYPLVCLEAALVAEAPLVCFDKAGGTTELAGDGGGFVVPYLDAGAAASAILELMHDEELRRRMGCRLVELVRSRHDVAKSAPKIHALISELV
jgi:glycosyltransferase involved in cell wall biosynthesis